MTNRLKNLREKLPVRELKASGAMGLAALSLAGCLASGDAKASTPKASPSISQEATPSSASTETLAPVAPATPEAPKPSVDAISEQLMSPSVSIEEFAKYPQSARIAAGLVPAIELEDNWIGMDLFSGSFSDGTTLDSYNPIRGKVLNVGSTFKDIYRQNMFFEQLMSAQRVSSNETTLDKDRAIKIALGPYSYSPESTVAVSKIKAIGNQPNLLKFSSDNLRDESFISYELKRDTQLDDGSTADVMEGVVEVGGQQYTLTFVFVPVESLGAGNGIWTLQSLEETAK